MTRSALIVLLTGSVSLFVPRAAAETLPSLSSLHPGCKLAPEWVGVSPALPEGVFLVCGEMRSLVLHPNNLIGNVTINTPEQALEYVRFFTGELAAAHFLLDGMVELIPGRRTSDSGFNVVEPRVFSKYFHEARARRYEKQTQLEGKALGLAGEVTFEISRSVLLPNQRVFEIKEIVSTGGYYDVVSRRLVLRDARRIGVEYFLDR